MKILLLSTYDKGGGAEKVAYDLMSTYRSRGHEVRMLVRYRRTLDPDVQEVDPYKETSSWSGLCVSAERSLRSLPQFRGQYRLVDWLRRSAWPRRWLDQASGIEDFNYPYSYHLADDKDWLPDVVHAHNLHGDYFDLRSFNQLSKKVSVVWTLHDTWAFTGHCAYFLNCQRWQDGCGQCPDLDRPPTVIRDQTAENWNRKRQIYSSSRLSIVTPSNWLMSYVKQSILKSQNTKVIPNGVDLSVFTQGNRQQARYILGLPQNVFICTFVAYSGGGENPYKDVSTIERAVKIVTEQFGKDSILFVCIGGERPSQPKLQHYYTGYISDVQRLALYYQASDVLLHAAKAENFPCVIIEAMACGTPIIATEVGGIPEQVVDNESGFLVKEGDSTAMAQRIIESMQQPDVLKNIGQAALARVHQLYGLDDQCNSYLEWFTELQKEYRSL